MAKDKYDFIQELLKNEKLNPIQRTRILSLASNEISKDKETGAILEERVSRLEEKLGINILDEEIDAKRAKLIEKGKPSLPKYLYPSSLFKYLIEYNQNTVLKSTCHEVDTNALQVILGYCETEHYDFEKHLELVLQAFEEHDKKYFCVASTKALIRGYITGKDYKKHKLKNGWSSDKIEMSWCDDQLLEWAKNNKMPPNSTLEMFKSQKRRGFDIAGFSTITSNRRIQSFRELVLHFKRLFHIRADNSLKSILENINGLKKFNEKIEFELADQYFPSNIELFTDVDKLIQGYMKIIELIIEQHSDDSKPKVKLSFYEKGRSVFFSIHHLNNRYNKSLQNTIERMGQTYTNLINNQLNGMCNFYLRTDFGSGEIMEVNLWNEKDREAKVLESNITDIGVEHLFEFCKN